MTRQRPLERLMRRRLRALVDAFPGAIQGNPDALHKTRVASRRLREALPLAAPSVPARRERQARRAMRRITRLLGPVREHDVSLRLLDELEREHPEALTALQRVRGHIDAERVALRERMLDRLQTLKRQKLERSISRVTGALGDSGDPDAPEDAARGVLALRTTRRAERLQAAIEQAGALYAPESIHAVRVSVKKLRYALELARELQIMKSPALVKRLKRAQETLGQLHDLQVLTTHIGAVQAELPAREPAVSMLNDIVTTIDTRCRQLHAAFLTDQNRLIGLADNAVETVSRRPPARKVPRRSQAAS